MGEPTHRVEIDIFLLKAASRTPSFSPNRRFEEDKLLARGKIDLGSENSPTSSLSCFALNPSETVLVRACEEWSLTIDSVRLPISKPEKIWIFPVANKYF